MMLVLGGCGGQQQAAPAAVEPTVQEQTVEPAAIEGTSRSESATVQEQAPTRTTTPAEQQSSYIGEDEAKRIAFVDAGVAEQDTARLKVELDTDDGVTKYEVGFDVGQTEYDYDIDPVTGAILERSAEIDD